MTDSTEQEEQSLSKLLYIHTPHPHQAANVNRLHAAEQREAGVNARIAVRLTRIIATMYAAYTFSVLAIVGLLAILGMLPPLVALLVAWTSQTLIQLCMLPIIMVGQSIIGRKQELLAEETFATTRKNDHELLELHRHQEAQDRVLSELLEIARRLSVPPPIFDATGLTKEEVEEAMRRALASPSSMIIPTLPPAGLTVPPAALKPPPTPPKSRASRPGAKH